MRVLLVEWASSQTVGEGNYHSPYLKEGKAMLLAVIDDLTRYGHQVVTIARPGLIDPIDNLRVHEPTVESQFYPQLETLAGTCDVSVLIAPECDGILEAMVRIIEKTRVQHIGCSSFAVSLCADKLLLHHHWSKGRIPTPDTWTRLDEVEFDGPLIIKPKDGAGSERTTLVQDLDDARFFFAHHDLTEGSDFIVQPYVSGMPASIACLTKMDGTRTFMPACGQIIDLRGGHLSYEGGWSPISVEMQTRCERLANLALKGIKGIHGWTGVDMVLGDSSTGSDDFIIEINPRLTSSYLGIRQLVEPSPVPWWIDMIKDPLVFRKNPEKVVHWTKSGLLETSGGF